MLSNPQRLSKARWVIPTEASRVHPKWGGSGGHDLTGRDDIVYSCARA